jgi:NAD(P)-dependent dehydrogenase (short-subunit alcohol dehydrogenase family)
MNLFQVLAVLLLLFALSALVIVRSNWSKRVRDLRQCLVVITGCSTGFGLALAKALTEQGCPIVATCRSAEGEAKLKGMGIAVVVRCDVTREEDVQRLSGAVNGYLDTHPQCCLWGLINNAGIPLNGFVDWLPMEAFRDIMEVNYFAPIRLIKIFLPLLKKTYGSRIINVSSLSGYLSGQFFGAYSGSKHALEGLGKAIRDELKAWGIHVW